ESRTSRKIILEGEGLREILHLAAPRNDNSARIKTERDEALWKPYSVVFNRQENSISETILAQSVTGWQCRMNITVSSVSLTIMPSLRTMIPKRWLNARLRWQQICSPVGLILNEL